MRYSNVSNPDWMRSYLIHGHNGNNGSERIPHVHVDVSGKSASVDIESGQYIVGKDNIPRNRQEDVLAWVRDNRNALMEEWNSKSNPWG